MSVRDGGQSPGIGSPHLSGVIMHRFTRTSAGTVSRARAIRLGTTATVGAAVLATAGVTAGPAVAHDTAQAAVGSASHSRDGAGRQLAALKKSLAVFEDVTAAMA